MDKKTALELYTLFRQENSSWLAAHREHSQQYFTLVVAILGVSIAAISQFDTWRAPLILIIMIGPLFNIRLCQIAITMCSRSYQAYLEGISIQSKLEQTIGLTEPRIPPAANQLIQFSKDEYFLPERWLESRHFATAKSFVEESMSKGANQIIKQSFGVLSLLNILVAIGIFVYALLRLFDIV
jgi:hypothetical protein